MWLIGAMTNILTRPAWPPQVGSIGLKLRVSTVWGLRAAISSFGWVGGGGGGVAQHGAQNKIPEPLGFRETEFTLTTRRYRHADLRTVHESC